ncbi:MAG: hypothetical protein WCB14_00725 [Candidatus Acidiferrales bacterium]
MPVKCISHTTSMHQWKSVVLVMTATETQLDFSGVYKPPFGAVGKALSPIVAHRIAEVSVHRFISDVAGYLQQALG